MKKSDDMNDSFQTKPGYLGQPAVLLLSFTFAVSLFAFWGGLSNLFDRWITQDEYSYGFFIPIISIWLIAKRIDALTSAISTPAWSGLFLVVLSTMLLVLGELTALYYLIQAGFIIMLYGMSLSFSGFRFFKLIFLPLSVLFFAIPLPYFVDAQLSWRLQLISSELGVWFLRLIDVSVYLEGNVIDFGLYKLQVVEACSGLRYLYPLMSIGFLVAYMYRAGFWKRAVLFISAIPITILMNSFRIAVIGILVGHWGSEMADGFLHFFEGWVIFIACLLILLFEIWIFEKLGQGRSVTSVLQIPDIPARGSPRFTAVSLRHPLVWVLVLLLIAAVSVRSVDQRAEIVPERQDLVTFPLLLADWKAQESVMETQVEIMLGLDDYLLADYRHPSGGVVNFYVAYYGSQRKGVSPHSPSVCIPGGGWLITSLERIELTLDDGSVLPVVRTLIERNNKKQLVYYWYEQRGRRIANEYLMKLHLLSDALLRNRTDGALVRVTTPVSGEQYIQAAEDRLERFINLAMPLIPDYVPH